MGYQVECFGGYQFERVTGAFTGFVDQMHKLRTALANEGDQVGAQAAKLIMNGLYGRLAMKPIHYGTVVTPATDP
jgi:hypothetical protein